MNDKTEQSMTDDLRLAARTIALVAEQPLTAEPEPAARQFQGRDGMWHNFIDERHLQNTVEDGSWPLRNLYTQEAIDNLRAQLAEAQAALKTVMRNAELSKEPCGPDPESPAAIRNAKFASLASVAAQGLGMVSGPSLTEQLAEAQRDSERLDWMIEQCAYVVSDPDCCDGYWLNYARPDGTVWTQATEHETPRAAIDAAKGESDERA